MNLTVTAGHGGNDPGAVRGEYIERDMMARLRDIVAHKARARFHEVRTDGAQRLNLPLAHALTLIPGSDVAIELHTNAHDNPQARGVEVVAMPGQKALAQRIAQGIARVLEAPVRGDQGWIDQRQSARGRLGFVRLGGLVVEVFFLSNEEERAKYLEREWLVASAICDAVSHDFPIE